MKLLKTTIHKVMSGLVLRDQTRADKTKCNLGSSHGFEF